MAFFLRKAWNRVYPSDQARAYCRIAETQDGLLVIHDLANRFHILTPHTGGAYEEGQRSVVLHILQRANFTEEDFYRLQEIENQSEEQS